MKTTIEIIEKEMKANNMPTTGIYSELPNMVLRLVNNIKHFGSEEIKKSTLGKKLKEIALDLSEKDTRKLVIKEGKSVLV